jgi:hypothetical protein
MHTIRPPAGTLIAQELSSAPFFATRKLLNSQVVQNMKSPFSNPHAGTAKLCGHSPDKRPNYSIGKFRS